MPLTKSTSQLFESDRATLQTLVQEQTSLGNHPTRQKPNLGYFTCASYIKYRATLIFMAVLILLVAVNSMYIDFDASRASGGERKSSGLDNYATDNFGWTDWVSISNWDALVAQVSVDLNTSAQITRIQIVYDDGSDIFWESSAWVSTDARTTHDFSGYIKKLELYPQYGIPQGIKIEASSTGSYGNTSGDNDKFNPGNYNSQYWRLMGLRVQEDQGYARTIHMQFLYFYTIVEATVSCEQSTWTTPEQTITVEIGTQYTYSPPTANTVTDCPAATITYQGILEGQVSGVTTSGNNLIINTQDPADITTNSSPITFTVIQSADGVTNSKSTTVTLNIEIYDTTCNAGTVQATQPINLELFVKHTLQVPKVFQTSYLSDLCGDLSLSYSTFCVIASGDYQEEHLPYAEVDDSNAEYDILTFRPYSIADFTDFDSKVYAQVPGNTCSHGGNQYDGVYSASECEAAAPQIGSYSGTVNYNNVSPGCFTATQDGQTWEAWYNESPEWNWSEWEEDADREKLCEDTSQEGVNCTITVTRTIDAFPDVVTQQSSVPYSSQETIDLGLTMDQVCPLMTYSDPGKIDTLEVFIGDPFSFTPDTTVCFEYDLDEEDEGEVASGCRPMDSNEALFSDLCNNAIVIYQGIQEDFMTVSSGDYMITFEPTQLEHLGLWPITIQQKDPTTPSSSSGGVADDTVPDRLTDLEFEMFLNVETIFWMEFTGMSESFDFILGNSTAVHIPYNITTQTPSAEQEYFFEFQMDGSPIKTDWITIDQEIRNITVFPEDDKLYGFHTIDVICTARYTNKDTENDIIPYLVDPLGLLSRDTVILQDSFYINIMLPPIIILPGPSFDFELVDPPVKEFGESLFYELPSASDPYNAEFTIKMSVEPVIGHSFIKFKTPPEVPYYAIEILQENPTEKPGLFRITLTLTAIEEDGTERTNTSKVSLSIQEPEPVQDSMDILESDSEYEILEDAPPPKIHQTALSPTGNLEIKFDQKMKVFEKIPDENDINLYLDTDNGKFKGQFYIYEDPALANQTDSSARRLQVQDNSANSFLWTVKNMTALKVEFVLDFSSPLEISQSQNPDRLQVDFISDKFISERSNKRLQLDDIEVSSLNLAVPKQFPSLQAQQQIEQITTSASSFVNVNIIFMIIGQFFAGKIIKKIVPLFLTLQVLFHMLVTLDFPLNTHTVLFALDDAIKLGALKRFIFDKLESGGYLEQVQDVKDYVDEVGMIVFVGIPLVVFLVILAGILIYCCKSRPKVQEFGLKLKDKLVLDMIINMMVISSLAFAVQAGFGRKFNFTEERPNASFFQIILILGLLVVTYIFATHVDDLEKDHRDGFRTTFGVLYLKYRYEIKQANLFLFYFISQRTLIVLFLNTSLFFSLKYFLLAKVIICWIIYLILIDPYLEKQESVKETINSILMLLFCYFIPAYTFMTPEAQVRYSFGFYTIVILGILIMVNLIWMIVSFIQDRAKQKIYQQIREQKVKEWQKQKMENKYIVGDWESQKLSQRSENQSEQLQEQKIEHQQFAFQQKRGQNIQTNFYDSDSSNQYEELDVPFLNEKHIPAMFRQNFSKIKQHQSDWKELPVQNAVYREQTTRENELIQAENYPQFDLKKYYKNQLGEQLGIKWKSQLVENQEPNERVIVTKREVVTIPKPDKKENPQEFMNRFMKQKVKPLDFVSRLEALQKRRLQIKKEHQEIQKQLTREEEQAQEVRQEKMWEQEHKYKPQSTIVSAIQKMELKINFPKFQSK